MPIITICAVHYLTCYCIIRFKVNKQLQEVMATLELMQAIVTVWAGVLSENPAPSAASRATFEVLTS